MNIIKVAGIKYNYECPVCEAHISAESKPKFCSNCGCDEIEYA